MSLKEIDITSALLQRAAQGDEEAFGQLFFAWKDKLYGFIFSITRSETMSEDMVQEVFLKIWQQKEKLQEVNQFSSYLFRIAQNHAIDQLRKLTRESGFLSNVSSQNDAQVISPEHLLFTKEVADFLHNAIESLPQRQKEVYRLHQQQGYKHEQIAQQLGLNVSTVRNHMFRALENLREKLAARFPETYGYVLIVIFLKNFF